MPLSVGSADHLEFKLRGLYDTSIEVNNLFHYNVTANAGATLDQFAAGFWFWIAASLRAVTTPVVEYLLIEARILDENGDLVNGETYPIATAQQPGVAAGETLPPFVAWTFKYLRQDATFRHGFKRFAGVPEEVVDRGRPTSGFVSTLNTLATNLQTTNIHAYTIDPDTGFPDAEVAGATMSPTIIQRVIARDPIVPVNFATVPAVVFDKIGSQNSRKIGVGI